MCYTDTMAFNRNRNDSRGGGGFRPRFGDRGDRGPVTMHRAICDNCGKECEVPFRPTSGKPIFCSSCFENKRGSSERSEDRQMFDATCADCGNKCSVPFRPSSDKPVFCSNCFGEKKNAGGKDERNSPALQDKIEELSVKLDKILSLLSPAEKPIKVVKKKASSKKK